MIEICSTRVCDTAALWEQLYSTDHYPFSDLATGHLSDNTQGQVLVSGPR